MLSLEENIERLKRGLDDRIVNALKLVEYLKSKDNTDPWQLGVAEGQLLTFEYIRRELENDEVIRKYMLEDTLERLIAARTKT